MEGPLLQIVTQARTLYECLNDCRLLKFDETNVNDSRLLNDRLNRWCQVAAQGNSEKFQKRLQWDGLDADQLQQALESVNPAERQSLPDWSQTLDKIIKAAVNFDFQSLTNLNQSNLKFPLSIDEPLPFEHILLPAILVARQSLLTHLNGDFYSQTDVLLEILSEEAYQTLERSLLERLVILCVKTLELEFAHFRPLGHSLLNSLIKHTASTGDKTHYNAFVKKLLQDGLLTFFQKYPVLARLVATVTDFWVEATAEFLQRLKADLPTIQQAYYDWSDSSPQKTPAPRLNKVTEIKPGLSDPHNRGRSVIVLTFGLAFKLVYKPKNLGLEVAYNQFLNWCNQHGSPLPFKVLKVMDCQAYGWVEYVEQLPCKDLAAAQRFYHRAGMLLCLLYLLGGTDCHYENLIASGEHLVLIDTETLMHHEANSFVTDADTTEAEATAVKQLFDSVLRTGLLPRWNFSKNNHIAYDISGLGGVDCQNVPIKVPLWQQVNTDDMYLGFEKTTMPVQGNVPYLNDVALSPNDYLNHIIEGFEQMYYFLLKNRTVLLSTNSPLIRFKNQYVRFVFRNTQVYGVILQKTLDPNFLQNGVDRSIELEILSRAFLAAQDKPDAWQLLQAEQHAMEQLDIPYFAAMSSSTTLTVGLEQPLNNCFQQPGYTQVEARLKSLDHANLNQQVAIVRGSFYASAVRNERSALVQVGDSNATIADVNNIAFLSSDQLRCEAQAIAEQIQKRAIWGTDGSASWIGLGFVSQAERFQLQPLGINLYDGNCGIALFLATLDYISGSTQFYDLVLGALASPRKLLLSSDATTVQKISRTLGVGGISGLGSIIYSLVKISKFLQEPTLLEDALKVANRLTPELIACDRQFDVTAGAAGAILSLLALYTATSDATVLERAVICGQHLLTHQTSIDDRPKAWKSFESKPLTGFSHGAAGIAYALLKLYAQTSNDAYLKAAIEGIAYERSVFSTAAANWPDFRSFGQHNDQPEFMVSWCHGATGIGLSRLATLEILNTNEIHQDIEIALQTTQKVGLQEVDNLCCGNLGRIELLLIAAKYLSRPELFEAAQRQVARIVAKSSQMGAYHLFVNLPRSAFSPGFFQGSAGIGYSLLRLGYPDILPSVLLLL